MNQIIICAHLEKPRGVATTRVWPRAQQITDYSHQDPLPQAVADPILPVLQSLSK